MTRLTFRTLPSTLAAVALALLAAGGAQAVDSSTPAVPYGTSAPNDPLGGARKLIAEQNWRGAIEELQRVNLTGSADWNNLMGYSHRKARTPDFAAAERYYDAALKIDPKHRGALEYSGELYLMMGDLARAEARLAALDKACFLPCEEHKLLKASIERHKAAKTTAARP